MPGIGCENLQHFMSTPEISVVVPCFNAERYVVAAVRSVLAQGGTVEVIVVDDGSTDGSAQALRQSGLPITVIKQANQGVAVARNAGIEHARGRWVAFIDADDIWLPGKLAAQRRLLAANPGARMAYTAWHVWHSSDPEPAPELLAQLQQQAADSARWQGASGSIYPELLVDCVVWTSTVLAERSLFAEAGAFDPGLRVGEDYDLWLRLSRLTPILRVCEPLALYRMHPASITRCVPDRNFKAEVIGRALARWGYAGPDGRMAERSVVDRGLARSWSDYAGAHLMAGDTARARDAALAALRSHPGHVLGWKVLAKSLFRPGRTAAV